MGHRQALHHHQPPTTKRKLVVLFSPVDVPAGWEETEEEHDFELPHLRGCHGPIEGRREFRWKAEVTEDFIH